MTNLSKPKRERHPMQYRGTECLNCGHPLDISDRYCPQCSQANNNKKRTLADFIEEFLSTLVAYDSRLLTTLSAMLFHPGRMTIEYLKGKRMTYTNPFRFLLSLSIIYFLLLSLTNDFRSFDNDAAKSAKEVLEEAPGPDLTNSRGDSGTSETKPETLRLDSTGFFSEKNDALIAAEPGRYYNEIKAKGFWERFFKKTELYLALIRHENPVNYESLSATHQLPQTWDNRASFSLAR
ncbi:DUF3667 domain-containing protein, partial [Zeaxanthinibacter enoshimensis]|uniref:DUF3667 domain-containing protein n=1 Tax=Zeaxanthinibacter enoshimensis TaxID=392009 RepID=UPI00356B5403